MKDDQAKIWVIVSCLCLLYGFSYGQGPYQFTGIVLNESNKSLAGASINIQTLNKGEVTDANGEFTISNLPEPRYEVEVSYLGYETLIEVISLEQSQKHTFQLEPSPLSLDQVVITDNYATQKQQESSLNIEVVDEDYLQQNLGGSLMKSLERLPGVSSIDIGSGHSKPFIRGLGFNRVVVVENNIKHEAQQWGADHGLEIDQYAVDNIEII